MTYSTGASGEAVFAERTATGVLPVVDTWLRGIPWSWGQQPNQPPPCQCQDHSAYCIAKKPRRGVIKIIIASFVSHPIDFWYLRRQVYTAYLTAYIWQSSQIQAAHHQMLLSSMRAWADSSKGKTWSYFEVLAHKQPSIMMGRQGVCSLFFMPTNTSARMQRLPLNWWHFWQTLGRKDP